MDLMEKILAFAAANPYLVTATAVMLIAVVAFELRLRSRAGFEVSVAETVRMINNGATVVDVREPARFAAGHIVDAVNISPGELVKGEQGKIRKKRAVVVVCDNGVQSVQCARKLREDGFEGAFSLGGGLENWLRDNQPLVRAGR
jgi:rhodanese-related sulfurtransferase